MVAFIFALEEMDTDNDGFGLLVGRSCLFAALICFHHEVFSCDHNFIRWGEGKDIFMCFIKFPSDNYSYTGKFNNIMQKVCIYLSL